MEYRKPSYEYPIEGVAWTRGSGHPAGVYLYAGRFHFAALGSPAQEELTARGALYVATVRFDEEELERGYRERPLRRLGAGEAVRRFPPGG